MAILLAGIGLLGFVLGLFYLKDQLESPRLARLAYSEFVMRLAVIAAVLIVVGALLALNKLLS